MTTRAIILAVVLIIASGVTARVLHWVKNRVLPNSDVYEALERKRLNAHIAEMEMELGIIPAVRETRMIRGQVYERSGGVWAQVAGEIDKPHLFADGTPVPPPPIPLTKGSASWNYRRGTVSGGPR